MYKDKDQERKDIMIAGATESLSVHIRDERSRIINEITKVNQRTNER